MGGGEVCLVYYSSYCWAYLKVNRHGLKSSVKVFRVFFFLVTMPFKCLQYSLNYITFLAKWWYMKTYGRGPRITRILPWPTNPLSPQCPRGAVSELFLESALVQNLNGNSSKVGPHVLFLHCSVRMLRYNQSVDLDLPFLGALSPET